MEKKSLTAKLRGLNEAYDRLLVRARLVRFQTYLALKKYKGKNGNDKCEYYSGTGF